MNIKTCFYKYLPILEAGLSRKDWHMQAITTRLVLILEDFDKRLLSVVNSLEIIYLHSL